MLLFSQYYGFFLNFEPFKDSTFQNLSYMNKVMKAIAAIMLTTLTVFFIAGCNKDENNDVHVTTYTPQDITQTSAVCGGEVILTEGLSLNELGVCWSESSNPTVGDAHLSTTNWSKPYVCTLTGLEPGTSYHVRAYALRGSDYYYGEDKSFTTEGNNGGGGGDVAVPEYVDLGLPSGTLWATFNIGANTPEGYGDYFAWGETEPKTTYNWRTYKWCNGHEDLLTKYCISPSYGDNGFTDNLTVLQPDDDAATANWGSEWQTPDMNQWWELINAGYTTLEWTKYNGVKGLQVKSNSNSQSIFFPISQEGFEFGSYWSSAIDDFDNDLAFRFFFYKDELIYSDDRDNRYNGHQVRPVRVEKGAPILVESIELSATSLILDRGKTVQLTATVLPADARQPAVRWHSSDTKVVNLDQSGKLTAVGFGKSTITCSATDGSGVKATCQVTVPNL